MGRKTWADNRNTFTLSSVFAAQRTLDGGWNWLQLSRTPRLNCNASVTQFACIRLPRFSKKNKKIKKSYNAVETQWPQCGGKSRLDIQFSFQINLLHFFLSSLTITLLERYLISASVDNPLPLPTCRRKKVKGQWQDKRKMGFWVVSTWRLRRSRSDMLQNVYFHYSSQQSWKPCFSFTDFCFTFQL